MVAIVGSVACDSAILGAGKLVPYPLQDKVEMMLDYKFIV